MRKANITTLKIWIASQPTLQNVPNRDTQKKVKENVKKYNSMEYVDDWI
jgi:hypothetical protein